MNNTRPYWKVIVSLIFSILATLAVVFIGWSLLRFLMPFVIGWIVSCIANPLVCWLEKRCKITKKWGSVIIIVLVIGAVCGVLYLALSQLVKELSGFVTYLPEMVMTVRVGISQILAKLPESMNSISQSMGEWIGTLSGPTVSTVGEIAKGIPNMLIGTIVALVAAYFFVAQREEFLAWVKRAMPKSVYERMAMVVTNFKEAVGGYFLAQFKIMGVVFVILFVGFTLLKVKYTFVLSLIISFLDFLPFYPAFC